MTRDRRPRRAIRLMSLGLENLEDRRLLAVSAQALLSSDVNMYWNYTDGLYGGFPGINDVNSGGTTSNSASGDGFTITTTTVYSYSYSSTTAGSSGNMTSSWNENDTATTTQTVVEVDTDQAGYTHHFNQTYVTKNHTIASGSSGPSGSSLTYTDENWTNELLDDVATRGFETVHAHAHNYMDWYWSGGGSQGSNQGSGGGNTQPTAETLTAYSVDENASGSGSMSVDSPPVSGGYNTFSDLINGGSTSLNETATDRYSLYATANQGSSGINNSTISIRTDGTENLNLSTTVNQTRSGSGSGSSSPGSDSSSLNDVASDTFLYSEDGTNGPNGPTGGFTLTSSGSNSATRQVSGGGSTPDGASDNYQVTDTHQSIFNSTDAGSRGPSPSDTLTDNTIAADTITTTASGTSIRTNSNDGTGSDSYSLNEITTLNKGKFDPNTPVYDTVTSGYNSSGSFSSGTLMDSGGDSTTIRLYGSGSGTIVSMPTGGSSSVGSAVEDSYDETETRTRSYNLNVLSNGSMSTSNSGTDDLSGGATLNQSYTIPVSLHDTTSITASLDPSGNYAFNLSETGTFSGTPFSMSEAGNNSGVTSYSRSTSTAAGGSNVDGAVTYLTHDGNTDFNEHTTPQVQHVGGPFTGIGANVTNLIDGSTTRPGMGTESRGASDLIVTAILPGDATPQTDSTELEVPVDTFEELASYSEVYGRTNALAIMEQYSGTGGTFNPLDTGSEVANPDGAANLSSQGQTFLSTVNNTLTTGTVSTIGGNNVAYTKSLMFTSNVTPALNGVYATKNHVYYTPGFLTTGFSMTRGQGVAEDPLAE